MFREFGPLSGNTMRMRYEVAPKIAGSLDRQTLDADARFYQRIGGSGLLALRARGFQSWGTAPDFLYFGGNSEMRGYEYLQFVGSKSAFLNAELRFPLIEAALTPLGVMGGIHARLLREHGRRALRGQAVRDVHPVVAPGLSVVCEGQRGLPRQSSATGTTLVTRGRLRRPRVIDGCGSWTPARILASA